MTRPRRSGARRRGGETPARRAIRRTRRAILALDPEQDYRRFLGAAARLLVKGAGARACAVSARLEAIGRDVFVLVPAQGDPRRRIVPVAAADAGLPPLPPGTTKAQSGFLKPEFTEMAEGTIAPGWVQAASVGARGRVAAEVELVDADPEIIPGTESLATFLGEVEAVFELALLYERLRRERLEARLLLAAGQELGKTLDVQEVLNTLLDLLREVVPYHAAAIYLLGEETLDVDWHTLRGYDPGHEEAVQLKMGQGVVGWVARTGEAEIVSDVRADARYVEARPATRAELVAPLKSGGRVVGVLNLEHDRTNAYTPHALELLKTFAGQAAVAVERARLLEQENAKRRLDAELQIARRIQRTFLPGAHERFRAWGLAGRMISSEEVSGDYYDFVEREDGELSLAVADVSGKGMPAALIMSSIRAAFRLASRSGHDPAALCRELNGFLRASLRDTEFVTGFFGFLHPATRVLRYCNAGHEPPLLLRAGGSLEWLESGGTVLGAFHGVPYSGGEVELRAGDWLVCYTDGVTEAGAPDGELFGRERLAHAVRRRVRDVASPEDLCQTVIDTVYDFVKGVLPDDLTVMVVAGEPRHDA